MLRTVRRHTYNVCMYVCMYVRMYVCMYVQVSNLCSECDLTFGKYYCEVCHLYDNKDKGQFHCDKCGLCR